MDRYRIYHSLMNANGRAGRRRWKVADSDGRVVSSHTYEDDARNKAQALNDANAKAGAHHAVVSILEDVADAAAEMHGRPNDDRIARWADQIIAALAKLEG